jgi:ABC-type sugar transport system substrate-binding protein
MPSYFRRITSGGEKDMNFKMRSCALIAVLIIPALVLWVASCSGAGGTKDVPIGSVGFVELNMTDLGDYWSQALHSSITVEAAKREITLYTADGHNSQSTQVGAIEGFIAQKVDFILLRAAVDTGWETVLGLAKAAGIPVVLVDRPVTTSDASLYETHFAHDFVLEGRTVADWLLTKMGAAQANIIELEGMMGSQPAIERKSGFYERIAGHSNMTILHSETANFSRNDAQTLMASLLPTYPSCNVVFAHNDMMALGAITAIEGAGKTPGTDILLVSIDGFREAMQAVYDGKLGCTVECTPIMGSAVFDGLQKLKNGESVSRTIYVTGDCYDKSKIPSQAFIDARPY